MSLNCPTSLPWVGVVAVDAESRYVFPYSVDLVWRAWYGCVSGLYGGAGYLCAVTHARGS